MCLQLTNGDLDTGYKVHVCHNSNAGCAYYLEHVLAQDLALWYIHVELISEKMQIPFSSYMQPSRDLL